MRISILTLLLAFGASLAAQCSEDQGYITSEHVDTVECAQWVTPAYDLQGLEIEIYYSKTPDSVIVYWPCRGWSTMKRCEDPECVDGMYRFYQDTTCQRSIQESVFMYNQAIRQLTLIKD